MAVHVPFAIDRPFGRVDVTLEVYEEDGKRVCGIYKLDGQINLPPRKWLAAVRDEMRVIERIAREAGCDELRIAGRNWAPILPDFDSLIGPRNGLRKAL